MSAPGRPKGECRSAQHEGNPVSAALSRRAMLAAMLCVATEAAVGAARADSDTFASNFEGAALLDQEGRRFDLAALRGRTVLVNFVYTGCSSVCPVQTRALVELQRSLPEGTKAQFLSVSLDPLSDTPAALKSFALSMGADLARWSFITGRPQDLERLAGRLRLYRQGARRPDDHATGLWLVNANGILVQRFAGDPPDVKRLTREIVSLAAMKG